MGLVWISWGTLCQKCHVYNFHLFCLPVEWPNVISATSVCYCSGWANPRATYLLYPLHIAITHIIGTHRQRQNTKDKRQEVGPIHNVDISTISSPHCHTGYITLGYILCMFLYDQLWKVDSMKLTRKISKSGAKILLRWNILKDVKFAVCAGLLFLHYCVWRSEGREGGGGGWCSEDTHRLQRTFKDPRNHSRISRITFVGFQDYPQMHFPFHKWLSV